MREIQDRYEIRPHPRGYVIRDMALRAPVSLDGRRVLVWPVRRAAEQWLTHCERVWGHHPNIDEHPDDRTARERNQHVNPAQSPWLTDWHDR